MIADRRSRGIRAILDGGRKELGPAGSGHGAVATAAAVAPARMPEAKKPAATQATSTSRTDADWKPQTSFVQSFTVAHPADVVWDFFGRVGEVASCLPGASLNGEPVDGHVQGMIKVKVGPIAADFHGVADVTRDEATRSGTIIGSGKDSRSNSATKGVISYSVKQGDSPDQTRVDVTIGFTLTGVLAQFSRSGLVQDVANRLIGAFVQNLEARLAHPGGGDGAPAVAAEFDAGSLMTSLIKDKIKGLFAKLFGRG